MGMEKPVWAEALALGNMTELTAMAPIKLGRVPGERRTYEERLVFTVSRLREKLERGVPTELGLLSSLQLGRITVIRPEQYLLYSDAADCVPYKSKKGLGPDAPNVPEIIDDYEEMGNKKQQQRFRSWAHIQVFFAGDMGVYLREIAEFLNTNFDRIFINCEDYPGVGDYEKFQAWIMRYSLPSAMLYAPNAHLSLARTRHLEDFKRRFDVFLDKARPSDGSPGGDVDTLLDEFLKTSQQKPSGFPAPGGVFTGAVHDREGR